MITKLLNKKITLLILALYLLYTPAYSQAINDDFEDGDLTGWTEGTTGHWANSTNNPISGTQSLKHNLSLASSNSYIYHDISSLDLATEDITWQFNLENGAWDPSLSNKFWVYLTANDNDLNGTTVDGYAVGVNLTGSTDLLTLWKVTDGAVDGAIISTTINWEASETRGIRVTRTSAGLWELSVDNDGGFDNLISQGTATNTDYTFGTNFGLSFYFSSSRAGFLWMDDILVEGVDATLSFDDLTTSLDEALVFMADKRTLKVNGLQNTLFSIKLYSINGKQVMSKSSILSSANGVNDIDLPQTLNSGVYIVKIATNKNSGELSKKIVIK